MALSSVEYTNNVMVLLRSTCYRYKTIRRVAPNGRGSYSYRTGPPDMAESYAKDKEEFTPLIGIYAFKY